MVGKEVHYDRDAEVFNSNRKYNSDTNKYRVLTTNIGDSMSAIRNDKDLVTVNRVEVIDPTGRAYVKYLKQGEVVRYSMQDENRTLKLFIQQEDAGNTPHHGV